MLNLTADEIETLFLDLGAQGITLVVQIEHRRLSEGKGPWTALVSGPAAPDGGIRTAGCETFLQCLEGALRALRETPGDWAWLDLYL
ncbi:hypothetical protein SMD20_33140 [Nonomuraea sp. LP-02]|uniref:hypothetical protein n=1 Tax=Nonomuraea sp. LP-02 TaxID=3097960 RepID=UPI002E321100|nr:hypothetical protein [Nonomuraea sp. LP-02]MED7929136.1 hypothetical protein [Nonomuraea sp. LP-02]